MHDRVCVCVCVASLRIEIVRTEDRSIHRCDRARMGEKEENTAIWRPSHHHCPCPCPWLLFITRFICVFFGVFSGFFLRVHLRLFSFYCFRLSSVEIISKHTHTHAHTPTPSVWLTSASVPTSILHSAIHAMRMRYSSHLCVYAVATCTNATTSVCSGAMG